VYDFNLADFVAHYRLPVSDAFNSIKFLEREGYIELTEELNNPSRVMFIVSRDDLYKFQVANASLDGFIKLVLRSYTGMFSEYVAVNEELLSKKSGLTRDNVYKFFVHLSSQNIIKYVPGKKTALVIFTEERLDRKSLLISNQNYQEVKDKYVARLDRMLDYVSSSTRCRVTILLDYFGEEIAGQCDVCMTRNELDLSKYEFDLILERIKAILENESVDSGQVVKVIGGDQDKTIKVLRWLLDHDKILTDDNQKLIWNQ